MHCVDMEDRDQRITSLDGMRLIAAFLITAMHGGWPPSVFGSMMMQVSRIAVPFFFVLSGYFYKRERTGDLIKRLFRIILWGLVLGILSDSFLYRDQSIILNELSKFFQLRFWLLNSIPFFHVGWFIMAYLYILIFLYFVRNFCVQCIFAVFSFIFAILVGPYSRLLGWDVDSTLWNCSFLSVFCWFTLGIVLSKYKTRVLQSVEAIPSWSLLGLALFFSFTQYLEYVSIHVKCGLTCEGTTYIATALAVPLVFILLLRHPSLFPSICRRSSYFVFMIHMPLLYILAAMFEPERYGCSYDPMIDLGGYKWIVMNGISLFLLTLLCYKGISSRW